MKSPAIKKFFLKILFYFNCFPDVFGLRISPSAPCNASQKQWTTSLSTHRLGEFVLWTPVSSLSSLPPEGMALGESLLLSQEVSQTKMGFPLTGPLRPQPNLPCCLKAPGSPRAHWHMGTLCPYSQCHSKDFLPLLSGDSLQTIAYFQNPFGNGISLSFAGEIWVLETINVPWSQVWWIPWTLKLRKNVPAAEMESTIHLIFQSASCSSGSQASGTRRVIPNEIACIPESPHTICWAVRGSLEWQTITSTCLFCSFIWPLVWTETRNPVSPASWVLRGHSCFCWLFWIRETSPSWTRAPPRPNTSPSSPLPLSPAHPLPASLWLRSQGKDCFVNTIPLIQ